MYMNASATPLPFHNDVLLVEISSDSDADCNLTGDSKIPSDPNATFGAIPKDQQDLQLAER